MTTSIEVEVVRDFERFQQLKDAWNAAVETSVNDSVFLTHEWFSSWIRAYAGDSTLCIVVGWQGDRIVGALPLMLESRSGPLGAQRILSGLSNLQTPKFGFILAPEVDDTVLDVLLKGLQDEQDWDVMEIDSVPEVWSTMPALEASRGKRITGMRSEVHMCSPYVPIAGTWEEYLATRDKKVLKNWRYFERRMEGEGETALVEVRGGESLDAELEKALVIEQSSWKGESGTSIKDSEANTRFYAYLAHAMSEKGCFALMFLTQNGAPVAFDYCLPYRSTFNVLKTGYNPEFSKSSPGRVLRQKVLRGLFEKGGYEVYDLLGAEDAWKQEWTEATQTLVKAEVFNRKAAAMVEFAFKAAGDAGKEVLRKNPKLFNVAKSLRDSIKKRGD